MVQLDLFSVPATGHEPPQAPHVAFVAGSESSEQAARAIAPHISELHRAILEFLRRQGRVGATDHEIAAHFRKLPDTCRGRRRELELRTLVKDSGQKRRSPSGFPATVWVLSEFAEQEVTGPAQGPNENQPAGDAPFQPAGEGPGEPIRTPGRPRGENAQLPHGPFGILPESGGRADRPATAVAAAHAGNGEGARAQNTTADQRPAQGPQGALQATPTERPAELPPTCPRGHKAFWQDHQGVVSCAVCHVPLHNRDVAYWIDGRLKIKRPELGSG